ncbi:uncharacterized protein si:ch211-12e13.12 [Fundulus heteroclitus]|uniref:uncharacterized protein si:ch211-12e13.12 n=1 Tax=Fundulus heteroclitus TaxID=8078 RepID=UPI00165CB5EB|nr:uncharacterized protein si:ch211-12e13.12 [Fundulus heteroclitus]
MKRRGDNTASTSLSPPPGSSSVQVCHDRHNMGVKMYPRNGHALESNSHTHRDQLSRRDDATYKVSSAPDLIPESGKEQTFGMGEQTFHRTSMLILDSSSQVYSGPEDNSTEPHESLTESSTFTFVDGYTLEEPVENHSPQQGVGRIYLKELVLIDDDEDGDMSLREKTVTDFSVRDGKAAELVCGRLLSTSTGSLSECREEGARAEAVQGKKTCCSCTLL